MNLCTNQADDPQPFGVIIKRTIIALIEQADTPMEREDRIQAALDAGAITYAESYQLRCGDDL